MELLSFLNSCFAIFKPSHWPPRHQNGAGMELDVFIKNSEKPLNEAKITLNNADSSQQAEGPLARFRDLAPDLYTLEVDAKGHRSQTLMIGMKKSTTLDVELRERR